MGQHHLNAFRCIWVVLDQEHTHFCLRYVLKPPLEKDKMVNSRLLEVKLCKQPMVVYGFLCVTFRPLRP